MIYKNIECPTCGNEIRAKFSKKTTQRCPMCKREFKVEIKGKKGKKAICVPKALDFTLNIDK